MKATLTFKLPEEQEEFNLATKAQSAISVIDDMSNWLRNEIKYNEKRSEHELKTLEEIQNVFNELITEAKL